MMRIWIGIGVFSGVLAIAFAFFAFRISEGPAQKAQPETAASQITDVRKVTDTYKKGVHAIRGIATVPTACTVITAVSTIVEDPSSTPVIRVDLSAEPDTGLCLQLPTDTEFSVAQQLSGRASVEVYANGAFATSTP